MNKQALKKIIISAMLMAVGFVLPFLTGQIPQVGNMLLPMHLPVFLCGLICGWQYGLAVGLILPLMRSLTLGMPPLYPTAIAMSLELCTYGLVVGLIYRQFKKQGIAALFVALISAMLAGRAVWGIAQVVLLGLQGSVFSFQAFLTGAFVTASLGIAVQLLLIPAVMVALNATGLHKFNRG